MWPVLWTKGGPSTDMHVHSTWLQHSVAAKKLQKCRKCCSGSSIWHAARYIDIPTQGRTYGQLYVDEF